MLNRLKNLIRREEGQTLVLGIFTLTALIAFVALAIDVGTTMGDKANAQRAADSAAMAGVEAARIGGNATQIAKAAHEWAELNGYDDRDSATDITVNIPPASGPYAGDDEYVEVIIDHQQDAHFAQVIGLNVWDVSARAVAHLGPRFTGLMPWAVLESAIDYSGDPTTIKYDANDPTQGNFGALGLFGTGSSNYEENIIEGVEGPVCTVSMPDCSDPTEITETGNMVGGTRDGVLFRLNNTISSCDNFDEVFTSDGSGGHEFIESCNPFVDAKETSLQVLLIPVVEQFCNGSCTVTLLYYTLFYLHDIASCTGSECEITGTFVQTVYDPVADLDFTPGDYVVVLKE